LKMTLIGRSSPKWSDVEHMRKFQIQIQTDVEPNCAADVFVRYITDKLFVTVLLRTRRTHNSSSVSISFVDSIASSAMIVSGVGLSSMDQVKIVVTYGMPTFTSRKSLNLYSLTLFRKDFVY